MSPRQKTTFTYEHAVLGFLVATPLHAYALHQVIVESPLGRIWHVKQSACYAIVARLAEAGFVEMFDSDDDVRGKRLLVCSDLGKTVFNRWCRVAVLHARDMRIEFLAKLYFCTQSGPEAVAELYANQTARCHEWLDAIPEIDTTDTFLTAVQRYRLGQIHATVAWMDACRPKP